jgi:hypothetical protein
VKYGMANIKRKQAVIYPFYLYIYLSSVGISERRSFI